MPEGVRKPRSLPSLDDALGWQGFQLDDIGGSSVAKIQLIFVDEASKEPAWVMAKTGRFGKVIAVPFIDCAPGVGHVWVPFDRELLKAAPALDPDKPLTRDQELLICEHYGIHDGLGRAAAVKERPEGAVTSQPAAVGG